MSIHRGLNQLFILIISCIIGYGCVSKHPDLLSAAESLKEPVKNLDIDPNRTENCSVTDLWSKIEIIPLETRSDALVGSFGKKIRCQGGRIYFMDTDQNAMFVFNDDGSFNYKISNIGSGPGEYSLIQDFELDPSTGNIELLNPRGVILKYNQEGEYIERYLIPPQIPAIHFFSNLSSYTTIFYSIFEEEKLKIVDRRSGFLLNEEYSFDDFIVGTPVSSATITPFYKFKDTVKFFDVINRSLYRVDKDSLRLQMNLNFGKFNVPLQSMPKDRDLKFYATYLLSSDFVYGFGNFIENDSLIVMRYLYKRSWHTIIIDKDTFDYRIYKRFKEGTVFPGIFDFFDNGMIAIIDPSQIQFIVNPAMLDSTNQEIFENIKMDDNPVIVKYYFK